jgi:hypothetical protein
MPLRVRVPPLFLVTSSSVTVSATGIPSEESFGNAQITAAGVAALYPNSISSSETFGNSVVTFSKVFTAYPNSITSAEAFGNHVVIPTGGGTATVFPSSILSAEAFGNAVVSTGGAVVSVRRYYPRHMRKFIGRR